MTDYFTGLDAVPGTNQLTDLFNKTAIDTDALWELTRFKGARIESSFTSPNRFFTKGENFLIPNSVVSYDSDGFYDSNSIGRLTIPKNVDVVEVTAFLRFPVGNWKLTILQTGDLGEIHSYQIGKTSLTNSYCYASVHTGLVEVTTGGYFEAYLTQLGSGTDNFDQNFTSGHNGSLITESASPTVAFLSLRAFQL